MEIPIGDHVIYNNDKIQFIITYIPWTISNTHHPYPGQCVPSPILFALCCEGYPTQFLPPALASNGYARSAQATRFFGQARMVNGIILLRGITGITLLDFYCEFCDHFLISVSDFPGNPDTMLRSWPASCWYKDHVCDCAAAAWLKTFPTMKLSLKKVGFVWMIRFSKGCWWLMMVDVEGFPLVTLNFGESQRLLQCH